MSAPHDAGVLGRPVEYPSQYDADLLFAIPRAAGRTNLAIEDAALPFIGADRWHAYEVSWLDPRGKPCVATAHFEVPATTPQLVESKSIKLYLNAFNGTRFADAEAVRARIGADLAAKAHRRLERERREPLPHFRWKRGLNEDRLRDSGSVAHGLP